MISDKGLYGLYSGVFTTAVLQPLENIKMALMLPPKVLQNSFNNNFIFNLRLSCQFIWNNDGIKGFYKGITAATMKAGLGCYVYFSVLRYLEKQDQSAFKNFLTSSSARIFSTFLTNPLSIIQTRFQLADFHQYTSVHGAIKDIFQKEGIRGFFSGAMASCIKEGFFGGLYYMFYEELKDKGFSKLTSGIISGMISTSISHPFEIIRARLQTMGLTEKHQINQHLIFQELKNLSQSGEWLKGVVPRLIKKPLANTLTFLIFELVEEVKSKTKA